MSFLRKSFILTAILIGIFGAVTLSVGPSENGTIFPSIAVTSLDAWADENGVTASGASSDWFTTAINTANNAAAFLSAIISPAIGLVSWLLSPDWTSGDLFGIRKPMYQIWTLIANVIYFIYGAMLVVIALMTMFNSKNYGYKVMLPRLAIGLIMVPFTWWFIQWTISLASVVTASVISIPMETMDKIITDKGGGENSWWNSKVLPKEVFLTRDVKSVNCSKEPGQCISVQEAIQAAGGIYSPLVIYAYAIIKIDTIQELNTGTVDILKHSAHVLHQLLLGIFMTIVFGILVLALTVILFVRAMRLWLYAIFSPLFSLNFVAKDILQGNDMFNFKEFIGLAFVPAAVGLALSLGILVIGAVQQGQTMPPSKPCTPALLKGEGCRIATIMGNPDNYILRKLEQAQDSSSDSYTSVMIFKFGGISYIYEGGAIGPTSADDAANITHALDAASGALGTIIIDIIALVFVWIAFMAAKNISTFVKGVIQPFEEIGGQVKSLAMSLPKYIPVPGVGNVQGISQTVGSMGNSFEQNAREKFDKSSIGKQTNSTVNNTINQTITIAQDPGSATQDKTKQFSDNLKQLQQGGNMKKLLNKDRAAVNSYLDKIRMDTSVIGGLTSIGADEKVALRAILGSTHIPSLSSADDKNTVALALLAGVKKADVMSGTNYDVNKARQAMRLN